VRGKNGKKRVAVKQGSYCCVGGEAKNQRRPFFEEGGKVQNMTVSIIWRKKMETQATPPPPKKKENQKEEDQKKKKTKM